MAPSELKRGHIYRLVRHEEFLIYDESDNLSFKVKRGDEFMVISDLMIYQMIQSKILVLGANKEFLGYLIFNFDKDANRDWIREVLPGETDD